jgi:hypothetical protein
LLLAIVLVVAVGGVAGPVLASGAVSSDRVGTTAATDAVTAADDAPLVSLQDQPEADATVTRIALHENGSATWTIEVRTRLSSGDEADDYEAFQERFRSNRSAYLADFRERMSGVVANANESLDRPMSAAAFGAATRIEDAPQRWGVVTYTFRWDGFAAGGDGRLAVGDVFGGQFFIEENSVLEIVLPEGHELETVAPTPDSESDGSLEWEGPTTFGDGEPRVVATSGDGDGGLPVLGLVGGIGLLLLLVGALVVAWRRGLLSGLPNDPETGADPATGAGTGATTTTGTGGADMSPADPGPITDEDQVRDVLVAHGGRCKQSRIVEELDWSKSKTSRVLSRMAEEDRVEKLRIGRENVIELPTEE